MDFRDQQERTCNHRVRVRFEAEDSGVSIQHLKLAEVDRKRRRLTVDSKSTLHHPIRHATQVVNHATQTAVGE